VWLALYDVDVRLVFAPAGVASLGVAAIVARSGAAQAVRT
jgi:hypothetical protein